VAVIDSAVYSDIRVPADRVEAGQVEACQVEAGRRTSPATSHRCKVDAGPDRVEAGRSTTDGHLASLQGWVPAGPGVAGNDGGVLHLTERSDRTPAGVAVVPTEVALPT